MAASTGYAVADLTALKNISDTVRTTGYTRFVVSKKAWYVFVESVSTAADDDDVVAPTSGTGRWFKSSSAIYPDFDDRVYTATKNILLAGSNVTVTPNDTSKQITLAGTGGGSVLTTSIITSTSTFTAQKNYYYIINIGSTNLLNINMPTSPAEGDSFYIKLHTALRVDMLLINGSVYQGTTVTPNAGGVTQRLKVTKPVEIKLTYINSTFGWSADDSINCIIYYPSSYLTYTVTSLSTITTYLGSYPVTNLNDGNPAGSTHSAQVANGFMGMSTSDAPLYKFKITFTQPITIEKIRVCGGQFNGDHNLAKTMWLRKMDNSLIYYAGDSPAPYGVLGVTGDFTDYILTGNTYISDEYKLDISRNGSGDGAMSVMEIQFIGS